MARLGQISFINNLPVVLPIQRGAVDMPAQTRYVNPAELNAAYAAGQLDIGAMSSFFYLEQGDFELVPGVSISCAGEVGSVLFYSRVPAEELHGKRVAVPASSATSINLLQVLLSERYGCRPDIQVEVLPDIDDKRFAGALVIGDHALRVDADWSRRFQRIDLGEWWHRHTGLPMVFGVWAATPGWLRGNVESFESISSALSRSAKLGLSELFDEVVAEAAARTALSREVLVRYYRQQLNYELTPRHLEGLELYRELCVKHGLLQEQKSRRAAGWDRRPAVGIAD